MVVESELGWYSREVVASGGCNLDVQYLANPQFLFGRRDEQQAINIRGIGLGTTNPYVLFLRMRPVYDCR